MTGEPFREDRVTSAPESEVKVKSGAGLPSRSSTSASSRRAVGVVRVSRADSRDGESFVSPNEQIERIRAACERDDLKVTAERAPDARRRAVARGVPPFANIPPGYRRVTRLTNGKAVTVGLEPDPETAPAVAEAFQLRERGATIAEVRAHLAARGIKRSYHGTQALLESRVVLGELHFGELANERAHEPIVDRSTWRRVQRVKVSRGRRPKSDRLLARIGVLRCATCGGRMVVGSTKQQGKLYGFYRCSPIGDCPQRLTISAELAERVVVDEVKRLLDGVSSSAAADTSIADAEAEHDRLERELEAAVLAFDGLDDVDAARLRLHALREERDRARDRLDDVRGLPHFAITVTAADWDSLALSEQRDLVQAVIESATVSPGRGAERIRVEPRRK